MQDEPTPSVRLVHPTNGPTDNITLTERFDPLEVEAMRLFVQHYKDFYQFNHSRGMWMIWDDTRWRIDERQATKAKMIELCDRMRRADAARRRPMGKISFAENTLKGAQTQTEMAATHEDFDQDPYLLGTPAGYIDLKTGKHHKPDPTKRISKTTNVTPQTGTPKRWIEFMKWATDDDKDMLRYLQKFLGYCLSGLMHEEVMSFIYGPGGNGKGVMMSAVAHIMGDYYVNTPASTFMATGKNEHSTELARLNGARLVSASETGEDDKWNLARIKEITGNETPLSARFMRQDFFEFWPVCKLLIIGNNKPQMGSVDAAIARRLRLVNFKQTPRKVDTGLKAKMHDEYSQILNWMVNGFKLYLKEGLTPPEGVSKASQAYLSSEDVAQQFVTEWLQFGSEGYVLQNADIKMALNLWRKDNGITAAIPPARVYKKLDEQYGLEDQRGKYKNKHCYRSVRLTTDAWKAIGVHLRNENIALPQADGLRGIPEL